MTIKTIPIDTIDASGRLRETRPEWVAVLAEELTAGENLPPIEVVATETGHRLIAGAHRLLAHRQVGRIEIEADVKDASAYADAAACRLREIKENMVRFELTVLDRAVALAEWKRLYEAANPLPKRGRPSSKETLQDAAKIFAERFSSAAASVLNISERSIYFAVEIATIDEAVRRELTLHPIADNQGALGDQVRRLSG